MKPIEFKVATYKDVTTAAKPTVTSTGTATGASK